jgi:hypothetical protein
MLSTMSGWSSVTPSIIAAPRHARKAGLSAMMRPFRMARRMNACSCAEHTRDGSLSGKTSGVVSVDPDFPVSSSAGPPFAQAATPIAPART